MIRQASLLISLDHIAALRVVAWRDSTGCAENSAELILSGYFATRPEIADLVKMEADAKKQARAEWAKKWDKDDQLP